MVVLFSVFGRFDTKSFIRDELAPGITRSLCVFAFRVFSSLQTTGVVFWGWGDQRFWLCQEHYQQTDRYLMGWLEGHFVEFPWHLLLQGVLQIYRWSVSERHFAASRGRDEQCQCPTETLLPPSPGIILRTGRLFQLRFHCFSPSGQLIFLH